MKLIVIILCLLSERQLVHAVSHSRFNWFHSYFNALSQRIALTQPLVNQLAILLATVLPLVILCGLILFIFKQVLFGFIAFLLNLVIFYYCLGPQNPFYPVREDAEVADSKVAVGNYFVKVNGQLFAVTFWYILFGAPAALAYRLISLCREQSATAQLATRLTNLLDWIPARISVLLFLLVGNFQRGFQFFRQRCVSSPENNDQFLSEGGLLAACASETGLVQLPYAENLVEHAMIVFLVFLAFFTLVALV